MSEERVAWINTTGVITAALLTTIGVIVGALIATHSPQTQKALGGQPSVVVSVSPSPSPVGAAPLNTLTPGVFKIGQVMRHQDNLIVQDDTVLDLDTSEPGWGVTDRNQSETDIYIYRGIGTLNLSYLGYYGLQEPDYRDCQALTNYSTSDISTDKIKGGRFFCVKTSDGRFGSFEVEAVDGLVGDPSTTMKLALTVWASSQDAD